MNKNADAFGRILLETRLKTHYFITKSKLTERLGALPSDLLASG